MTTTSKLNNGEEPLSFPAEKLLSTMQDPAETHPTWEDGAGLAIKAKTIVSSA
jgi:hypothetical protein